MKILSIETSCDETAVSIVEANGGLKEPHFSILGNSLFSQIDIHKEYGGVFPALAKREHAKNLVPLLLNTLVQANMIVKKENGYDEKIWTDLQEILKREYDLFQLTKDKLNMIEKPNVDVITVTSGPGLEPALWVGICFAKALGKLWNIPVVGTNHMEGHIASVLLSKTETSGASGDTSPIENQGEKNLFPAIALLISGGHTEIVEIKNWGDYKILGQTRDDAVGEAFDKVARIIGLPYPGGPEISRLAEQARERHLLHTAAFPRPMLHSKDFDFSFSGLKTAVLYYTRTFASLSETDKMDIAREFEDAVVDVLLHKTERAITESGARTLIVAGGVIANKKIRQAVTSLAEKLPYLSVKIPTHVMATDNALMIACAAYLNISLHPDMLQSAKNIIANGNMRLDN